MAEPEIREKDRAVLRQINQSNDDVQKITEATTLENHEVNYCFTKLEDLGLIQIEKPDGYTTRIINGQKRTFKTPKKAVLTPEGRQRIDSEKNLASYEDLTHRELVEKVHQLETEVERLETTIQTFKKQVQKHLFK